MSKEKSHFLTKILITQIVCLYSFQIVYHLLYDYLAFDLGAVNIIRFLIYSLKALPGVFLLPALAYLCVQKRRTPLNTPLQWNNMDLLMLIFGVYQFLSLSVGLIHGNNFFYLIGDSYGLFIVVVFYFFTRYVYCMDRDAFIQINRILLVFGVLLSIFVLIRIGWRGFIGLPYSYGGKMIFLGMAYLSVRLVLIPYKENYWRALCLLLLVTLGLIFTFERTYWVGIAIVLGLTFLFRVTRPLTRTFLKTFVILVFTGNLFILYLPLDSKLVQRWNFTFSGGSYTLGLDESAYARTEENRMVWEHFLRDANLMNWFVGFGSGATFEDTSDLVGGLESSGSVVHQIHNAYVAIFHFGGIIGLTLFILLFVFSLWYFWKNRNKFNIDIQSYTYAIGISLLASTLMLIASRDFFADPLFSYMFAGLSFIENKERMIIKDKRFMSSCNDKNFGNAKNKPISLYSQQR